MIMAIKCCMASEECTLLVIVVTELFGYNYYGQ